MIQVFGKELNSFLNSLIAYVVIGSFLAAVGLIVWVFPETSVLDSEYAGLDALFAFAPYVFIFLIPAITMRSFSEETKLGTMELLLTKPLSDWDVVLGKFLASFALVCIALAPTLLYYFTVSSLGNPPGNLDTSGIVGSYLGLLLLAAIFCAVGVFASTMTSSQIVAFVLASFICFILYTGFDSLSTIPGISQFALSIQSMGILAHYESVSKGLIDSRDVVYFFSVCAAVLLSTKTILSSRSW